MIGLGYTLPAIVWVLALPIIAMEVVVGLAGAGVLGGLEGAGWRLQALERFVFSPPLMQAMIERGEYPPQHLMRLVNKDVKAKDLKVKDVMHPRAEVMGLSYQQLQHCTVGDVLNTLQKAGEPYAVVVDHEQHQIRGIISARDITARLHIAPVQIEKTPTLLNVLELESA